MKWPQILFLILSKIKRYDEITILKKKTCYFTLIDWEKFLILNPKLTRKDGSRIKYMYIALAIWVRILPLHLMLEKLSILGGNQVTLWSGDEAHVHHIQKITIY